MNKLQKLEIETSSPWCFALTTIKLSLEMFSKLSFLSCLFLTARNLEIHIKILVLSLVSMSALDDFSSLPTGILANPTESYNAIQSYMRKQNKILYNQKKPNTAIFLFLIIIKYFMFLGHLPCSAECDFVQPKA